MIKKVTAAILALTLSAGLFAGCSGGNSSSSSSKESSASSASSAESKDGKVDTSKEANLIMYLYGSRVLPIRAFWKHSTAS